MVTHRADLWEITLADGWEAECEEDCVTLYHPDGVGALQISSYHKESCDEIAQSDLLDLADLDAEAQRSLVEQKWGDFTGFQLAYSVNETFCRKWWLGSHKTMLFATYNSDSEHSVVEHEAVNAMMKSLKANSKP